MKPEISIVLPTYNGSRFISESIESCLNQTFENFELIIVNDCSTDITGDIINDYAKKDPRIQVINNASNKKLPISLNIGFEKAIGKYHTWTSDDNTYAPDALSFLHSQLETDPDTGFVYTDYTIINNDGKIIGHRHFGDINEKVTNFQGCSACFLYKSELFTKLNGYNPAAFLIEDYDFFMRCFLESRVKYFDRTDLYLYREHPNSLSSNFGSTVNDISKIMIERLIPKMEAKLPQEQLKLVYRKFAVYNAVMKNDAIKYKLYLAKLFEISKFETFKTTTYVFLKKSWNTLSLSVTGLIKFFGLLFRNKKP